MGTTRAIRKVTSSRPKKVTATVRTSRSNGESIRDTKENRSSAAPGLSPVARVMVL